MFIELVYSLSDKITYIYIYMISLFLTAIQKDQCAQYLC